jgi:hypothetical protein
VIDDFINDLSVTYGDDPISLHASSSSSLAVQYASSNSAVIEVVGNALVARSIGQATVTASQSGNVDYDTAPQVSATVTVLPAILKVVPSDAFMNYGASVPELTYTLQGFVNDENASVLQQQPSIETNATSASPLGVYPITVSGGSAANYSFQYLSAVLRLGVNTQEIVNFELDDNATYGDDPIPLEANSTSGLAVQYVSSNSAILEVNGSSLVIRGTGSATISAQQPGNVNYDVAPELNATVTILPASLQVVAADASKIFGEAIPTLSYDLEGFVNDENASVLGAAPMIQTNAIQTSPSSHYPITVFGGTADHYLFDYHSATLTITEAESQVDFAGEMNATYGDNPIEMDNNTSNGLLLSYESSNPDVIEVNGTWLIVRGAGMALVTATQEESENFLALPEDEATITVRVAKAELKVIANNASKDYLDAIPELTFDLEGFVNNDDASVLDEVPLLETNATAASPTGTYAITASGGAADDYSLQYFGAELTVGAGAQTINEFIVDANVTYGDDPANLSASASSGLPVAFFSSDPAVLEVNGSSLVIHSVGSATITARQSGDSNYDDAPDSNATVTVLPAILSAVADDASKVYGAAVPGLSYHLAGFVNDENTSVVVAAPTVSTNVSSSSPPGDYPITTSGGSAANYQFAYVDGTLTVLNTAPEEISLTHDRIAENRPVGDLVGSVRVSYPYGLTDMGPHTFSLSDGNGSADNDSFSLDVNGTLRTARILDYEDGAQLGIRIRVTDKYDVSFEKSFVVDVVDLPEQDEESGLAPEVPLPPLLADSLPLGAEAERWYESQWFGTFYDAGSSWIYHSDLGWFYLADDPNDPGAWLWMPEKGWLWLREDTYPWLFRHEGQTWIYFLKRLNDKPYFFNQSTNNVE